MSANNILCWDPIAQSIRPMTASELDDFAIEILEYMVEYRYSTGNIIVEDPAADGFNPLPFSTTLNLNATGIQFSDDGLTLFWSAGGDIYFKTLSYPYAVGYEESTPTSNSFSTIIGSIDEFKFYDSGTKLYIYSAVDERLYYFTLSIAFDLTTKTLQGSLLLSNLAQWETNPDSTNKAFALTPNGQTLFLIINSNGRNISQYTLSTAYDITTIGSEITYVIPSPIVSTSTDIISINFDDTGDTLIAVENSGSISIYDCDTAYSGPYTLVESRQIDDNIEAITFNDDGTILFANNGNSVNLYELQGFYGFNEIPANSSFIGTFTDSYYESYDTLAGETPYEKVTFTVRTEVTRTEPYTRDYTTTDFEGVGSTEIITREARSGPTYLGPGPDTFINNNWPFYATYYAPLQQNYVATTFGYVGPVYPIQPVGYTRVFYGPRTFFGTNPNITPYTATYFGDYERDYIGSFGVIASTEDFIGQFTTDFISNYTRYYGGDFIGTIDQIVNRDVDIYFVNKNIFTTFPDVPPSFLEGSTSVGRIQEELTNRQTVFTALADIVLDNLLADGPGTYEITNTATPPADGTWELIHEFKDAIYNDVGRLDNRSRLWRKLSQTKGTYYRPLKLLTDGTDVVLHEYTNSDIEQIVRIVQDRINSTGLATYDTTTSGTAPTTGLWQFKGQIDDYTTEGLTSTATYDGYTGAYVRDVLGSTASFGGTYTADYVGTRNYVADYLANPEYIGTINRVVYTNFFGGPTAYFGISTYYGPSSYVGTRNYFGTRTYIANVTYNTTYFGQPTFNQDYLNENEQYVRDYISGTRADNVVQTLKLWRRYQ